MKVKQAWFGKKSSDQHKKELRAALIRSSDVLERLSELLSERMMASHEAQRAKTNYDDPNWAVKQADFIGQQRTYKEILDLINTKD